jgi:hypothetical protein
MSRSVNVRRTLALSAALVIASWGATSVPAVADGDHGKSGEHSHAHGQSKDQSSKGSSGQKGKSDKGSNDKGSKGQGGKGSATGGSHAGGNSGSQAGGNSGSQAGGNGSKGGSKGDPAGNNGTVKIAPLGEMDSIPNNTPHPGCTFQIEWYGYDEGSDIVSTVTFAMQAPTKDVGLAVDGPSSVFVGGDPATGAGTDTGLDGTEAYTLSFTGDPQAQQGYHVKLTVATPRSKGNDTKTKVFWVQPCTAAADSGTGSSDDTGGTGGGTETPGTETETDSGTAESTNDTEVLGTQASAAPNGSNTEVSPAQAQAGTGGVPTAVDAGENGHSAFGSFVRSPWPLALVGLGAVLALAAVVSRRRHGVDADAQE